MNQVSCTQCDRRIAAPVTACPACGGAVIAVPASDAIWPGMLSSDGRHQWTGHEWIAADDDRVRCERCGGPDWDPEPNVAEPSYVTCRTCGFRLDLR